MHKNKFIEMNALQGEGNFNTFYVNKGLIKISTKETEKQIANRSSKKSNRSKRTSFADSRKPLKIANDVRDSQYLSQQTLIWLYYYHRCLSIVHIPYLLYVKKLLS